MTTTEHRVYATGHYSLIAMAWVLLAFFIWVGVQNELHPAPLLPPCSGVTPK